MDLRPVPSGITGPLRDYLDYLVTQLRSVPTFSTFSGTTPESVLTGQPGNFAYNPYSTTTNNFLYVKWGNGLTVSKTSWAKISLSTVS